MGRRPRARAFCQSLCTCGCNTRITRNRTVGDPYVATVLAEWALYGERLGEPSSPFGWSELHLGAALPRFALMSAPGGWHPGPLPSRHRAEFSVEVDRVTVGKPQCACRGANRISLGGD